jgi:hypothetical protein
MTLQRASLRPPRISDDAPAEDGKRLNELAKSSGFGISGGPSGQEADRAGEGDRSVLLPAQPRMSLRDRRPPKETRSFNFNCKMKPRIKDKIDEICIARGVSQADVIEMLIEHYDLKA